MFVDYIHQPWKTLAAIINKCLSGKTASNDKLRRCLKNLYAAVLVFYQEDLRIILNICPIVEGVSFTNVPDNDTTLAFLIKLGYKGPLYKHTNMFVDHMHQPWRTLAAIINKCLSGRTASNDKLHSPKKSRGKGSQRKETADDSQETLDVSKESEPEPKTVMRKTSSKRRVKKKVTLSADDSIISDDPDIALELGKSISQTKAEEAARQVHATHARIVMDSVLELTKRRRSGKVTFDPPKKLNGVPVLDESTVVFATSSERTGTKPGVPDEEKEITFNNPSFSTPVLSTFEFDSAFGRNMKVGSEQESEQSEEDKLNDEEKGDKEGDADDEDDETVSDEDDIYKYKIRVCKDEDKEMINAEVDDSIKGDKEVTDAAKTDAKKTSEVKDDVKKTELPPTSSSLSTEIISLLEVKIQSEVPHTKSPSMLIDVLSCRVKPMLYTLSNDMGVLIPVQESPSKAIVTTLPPLSVSTTPSIPKQTTTLIPTPTITTNALIITTNVSESDALFVQIPELPKKQSPTVDLEQGFEKSASEILKIKGEQAEKQQKPKFTIKSTDQAALNEYDQKSTLYQTIHANKSFKRCLANHRLYHALIEALIEDKNAIDKGVVDTIQDHKRKHDDDKDDDDDDPPAGPNEGDQTKRKRTKEFESSKKSSFTNETQKGKAPSKGSKTGKSATTNETVKEPITETKAARYEIEWIEDMVPTLWSTTKVGYDKDSLKGVKTIPTLSLHTDSDQKQRKEMRRTILERES
uniref:Uncharacterized protein n=1 Tax=Tanacetum cinerariifolium TaxID=118510 RepID=A0A6L2NQU0_TANCI|nr:hypothetical protein [Tanacetum cinerariifolium]